MPMRAEETEYCLSSPQVPNSSIELSQAAGSQLQDVFCASKTILHLQKTHGHTLHQVHPHSLAKFLKRDHNRVSTHIYIQPCLSQKSLSTYCQETEERRAATAPAQQFSSVLWSLLFAPALHTAVVPSRKKMALAESDMVCP